MTDKKEIIGIDLGTTFSAIARITEGGKSEIVPNQEGDNITPSVVEFVDKETVIVGRSAKDSIGVNDDNIRKEVKRDMDKDDVTYEHFGLTHTPVTISSLILQKLKKDFEANEAHGEICTVVVTYPANFTNEARENTVKAAKKAGLEVEYLIEEPNAAALAYAAQSGKELHGRYGIYDLGGGTFDFTIATIDGQNVDINTSYGVQELGGKDFDKVIFDIVSAKYTEKTGKEIDPQEFTSNDAEDLKKRLTSRDKADARVSGEVVSVTREEFETKSSNLISQAENAISAAMDAIDIKPSDINDVILVGGSSRMPMVTQSLKGVFDKDPVSFGNPDELVALGAALYAAYKSDSRDLNPLQRNAVGAMRIGTVAPYFFGKIQVDTKGSDNPDDWTDIVTTVIKKDSKLPIERTISGFTLHDNQTGIDCRVTQSLAELEDPTMVRVIWEGTLEVPGGNPAGMEILTTYAYSEDGRMRCKFEDVQSGTTKDVDLTIGQGAPSPVEDDIDNDKFTIE